MAVLVRLVLFLMLILVEEMKCHIHPKFLKFNDLPIGYPEEDQDASKWNRKAERTLMEALNKKKNTHIATNTILFIGDGMGITTITAGLARLIFLVIIFSVN
jgi:hypothetical protein